MQAGVHVVLLAAAIPRRGHLGSDPPYTVVPSEKSLPRCGHRSIPLRVTDAMTPCGLAHVGRSLRSSGGFARQQGAFETVQSEVLPSDERFIVGSRARSRRTASAMPSVNTLQYAIPLCFAR